MDYIYIYIYIFMPNRTFLVRFGGISGKFGRAMVRILAISDQSGVLGIWRVNRENSASILFCNSSSVISFSES